VTFLNHGIEDTSAEVVQSGIPCTVVVTNEGKRCVSTEEALEMMFCPPDKKSTPWHADCHTDTMTDQKTCFGKYEFYNCKPKSNLTIYVMKGQVQIHELNLYPHKEVYLRVDSNKVHKSNDYADEASYFYGASKLIDEMKGGKELRVRYWTWPEKLQREFSIPLENFGKTYNEIPR
jgi:hypothetical protein